MPSPAKTLAERLWPRLRKDSDSDSGCWLWTGPLSKLHDTFPCYPQVGVPPAERELAGGRKQVGAHRAAWLLTHGPVPDGLQVCHTCDVTTCANPAHLWIGTASENALDAVRKCRTHPTRTKLADMPRRLAAVESALLVLASAPDRAFTAAEIRRHIGLSRPTPDCESKWLPVRSLLKSDPRVRVVVPGRASYQLAAVSA